MSNIFLYGAHSSNALIRLELALEGISRELSLTRLPPGPLFSSTTSLKMRSNDILLLYAQTKLTSSGLFNSGTTLMAFALY